MPEIRREAIILLTIGQVWEFILPMSERAHGLSVYSNHDMKYKTKSV